MQLDKWVLIAEVRNFINATTNFMKEFENLNKTQGLLKTLNDLKELSKSTQKLTDAQWLTMTQLDWNFTKYA